MCRKLITPEIKRNVDYSICIADRIIDILERKRLTQREFAKRLNKNESEISSWLTGTHTFTTKTLAKIEIALDQRIFELDNKPKDIEVVHKLNMVYTQSTTPTNNPINLSNHRISYKLPKTTVNTQIYS